MRWLRVLGVLSLVSSFAFGCAKGKDVKSASKEDKLAFDEAGHGKRCDTPSSSCDEVKDPSLDFKEKCREAGFRMKQCGCENLCTGNINGEHIGFNSKNQQKICKEAAEKCESQETSAAYQDACDNVGGEMLECGCEWLCSKKLKEAIPDPPKEEEKKADDAASGDEKKDEKKEAKKDDARGNMDGKSADEIAREKSAKDQAAKDKAAQEKASKEKSSKEKSSKKDKPSGDSSGKKEKSRFFNDE